MDSLDYRLSQLEKQVTNNRQVLEELIPLVASCAGTVITPNEAADLLLRLERRSEPRLSEKPVQPR